MDSGAAYLFDIATSNLTRTFHKSQPKQWGRIWLFTRLRWRIRGN